MNQSSSLQYVHLRTLHIRDWRMTKEILDAMHDGFTMAVPLVKIREQSIILSYALKMKIIRFPYWSLLPWLGLLLISRRVSGDETIPSGLFWTNFSVQTADGRFLVEEWSGFVQNGHICGVLGPSGAGKRLR